MASLEDTIMNIHSMSGGYPAGSFPLESRR
jgi:hypothetical protein